MKKSLHSLRFITLFFLVFITLLGCREATNVKTKNFDIKDAEIQMNIPQSWEFEAIVGPTDSFTKYHGQFKRTDHGGFIDIETKLNQYYTTKTDGQLVTSEKVMGELVQSMKSESSLYKNLEILDETHNSEGSIIICRYIWGKKDELTFSLLAVSRGKELTKIIKVETWDQLKEEEQLEILKEVKNSLMME
ncbi:hypothetical protein [Flectobacillus rivi]|uniref:PsbP C-terminal domain-containing protein n=1 Tax=Flectobacillus rivi TaxID=2984209 RepID=A0ABT6YVM0_9BACT|nr:hypothetical protein [Flectobacillus rivi]MDI9872930.1 hypothetical protein [Flectobacillus rivi]